MGNIDHLIGGPRQSDSVEADKVNSIVERISGVNPSKLAAKVTGADVQTNFGPGGMGGGSMPRALQVAQQQMQPQPQGYLPGQYAPEPQQAAPQQSQHAPQPQMQAIMERMAMLEQKVAFYEQGKNPEDDKKYRGPSNRGPESRVWGRDIDPKKAREKDDIDGKPDSQQPAATKEHMMSNDVREAIGMDLSEWKKLAGLADPYGAEPSVNLTGHGQQALYEDVYEDMSPGEGAGANPKPAAPKPAPAPEAPKPGVARKVAKTMGTMMKSLGKGAARVGKASLSASVEQEFRAEMWEAFLQDRGLSVEVFGQLVDEAMESDDAEEMDALLAVEEVFERLLHQALEHYGEEGEPVEEDVVYGIEEWVAFLEHNGMDPREFDEVVRLAEHFEEEHILGLCQEVVQMFEVDVSMRLKHGGKQISRRDMDQMKIAKINKELKGFKSVATKQKAQRDAAPKKAAAGGGGEDPRGWFTKGKDKELRTSMESTQFEVDATEDGEPDGKQIPWGKIVKAYSSKEERGFGGMSRSGQ